MHGSKLGTWPFLEQIHISICVLEQFHIFDVSEALMKYVFVCTDPSLALSRFLNKSAFPFFVFEQFDISNVSEALMNYVFVCTAPSSALGRFLNSSTCSCFFVFDNLSMASETDDSSDCAPDADVSLPTVLLISRQQPCLHHLCLPTSRT